MVGWVFFLLFLINNFHINTSSDRRKMNLGESDRIFKIGLPQLDAVRRITRTNLQKVIQKSLDITPKTIPNQFGKTSFLRNLVDGLKSDMISTEVEKVNSSFPDRLIYGRQKSNFRIVDERKIAKREERVVLRYSFKSCASSMSRVGIRELHSIWNNSEALLIS